MVIFLLATHDDLEPKLQEKIAITGRSFLHKAWDELCDYSVRWISARSVGLLEIRSFLGNRGSSRRRDIWSDDMEFTHRSAKEFMLGTPDGAEIMSFDNRTPKQRWLKVAKALRTTAFMSLVTLAKYRVRQKVSYPSRTISHYQSYMKILRVLATTDDCFNSWYLEEWGSGTYMG